MLGYVLCLSPNFFLFGVVAFVGYSRFDVAVEVAGVVKHLFIISKDRVDKK
jgi:hypothetical protein